MLAHFLRSIADYAQRVGRQVLEYIVEVATIEAAAWDVVRGIRDDRGEIDVQRREHLFQMVGAAFEVLRMAVGMDRIRHVPGKGGDEFDVRRSTYGGAELVMAKKLVCSPDSSSRIGEK